MLSLIRKYPGISRSELVKITGLNPSTITKIVFDFIEKKFVKEGGKNKIKGPGRKTVTLFPSKHAAASIIAKIGVEMTRIGLGYLDNGFESVLEFKTPGSFEDFFKIFIDGIGSLRRKESLRSTIVALSVSVPGIVDRERIEIENLPHLGWKNVALGKMIEEGLEGFDLPILIENEAKLSLMAEMYFNERLNGLKDGVYIYISQGVGGALLVSGQIFPGNSFTAGEIGHMSIYTEGPVCYCGNRGCWEEYISIDTVVEKYERSGKVLNGTDFRMKFEDLLRKAEKDEDARTALLEMMHYLSVGITNLVNVLNPQFVMLGGMGGKVPNRYIRGVYEEVKGRALESAAKNLLIMPSSMGMIRSALVGCTLMAMDGFSEEIVL